MKTAIKAISTCGKKNGCLALHFIVMGGGPLKDYFESIAKEEEIDCIFTGPICYEDMVATMCSCDIVLNPIVKGAAQSITNKVGDYALSGIPIINTLENLEYRELIEEYCCGINCKCGNADEVADAIYKLAFNLDMMKQMGNSARRLGVERFDRRNTYQTIVDVIERVN